MMTPFLILMASAHSITAMIDYCKNHTFDKPTNSEFLHFSKENSDREFGICNKFKCLHCCSHGYRSIEWFKDGHPYPWPTDVSTLIVHPESGNQTICSQQSTAIDSGRYWCIARNDTHFLRHEIPLQISGPSISMGWPKTTYRPRDQKVDPGEPVRFYCEAFVGTIDLPDFQSEITWERYDQNQSFLDGVRVVHEPIFREEKRILGSYLYFKEVKPEDYGEYVCKVRNLGDQVVELSAWLRKKEVVPELVEKEFWTSLSLLNLLIVVAATSTICFLWFGILRLLRSRGSHSRSVDDMTRDVLVIYHKNDEKEALKAVSSLQRTCFYSYTLLPLQFKSELGQEDLKVKANAHRGVLALLSPSLVDGYWSLEYINQSIQGLLKLHFTVACMFLVDLPPLKTESGDWELLKDSLSKVQFIDNTIGKKRFQFWKSKRRKCLFQKTDPLLKGSWQTLI